MDGKTTVLSCYVAIQGPQKGRATASATRNSRYVHIASAAVAVDAHNV